MYDKGPNILRVETTVNRTRDLAQILYPNKDTTREHTRRTAAKIGYRIRLLRTHRLITKLPNSRRYRITQKGRAISTAAILSQKLTVQQLAKAAA